MKRLLLALCILAMASPVFAGEKEDLQQKLGANVAVAQKLSVRSQAIQAELGKIPKVVELSKENQEIQAKLQKLGEENQEILKKLDSLK